MNLSIRNLADEIDAENQEVDEKVNAKVKKQINKTVFKECGDVDKLYEDANTAKKRRPIKKSKAKKTTRMKVMNEEQKQAFFKVLAGIVKENEAKIKAEEAAKKAEWEAKVRAEKAAAAMEEAQKAQEQEKSKTEEKENTESKKTVVKAVFSRKSIEKAQNSLLSNFKKEMGGKDTISVANTVKRGVVLKRRRNTGRDDR